MAANPDLVLVGQRFTQHYDQIRTLTPNAVLVELDPREGEPFGEELVRQVTALGEIFAKQDEAAKLVADFEASVARVKAAYKPDMKVMALITSGGKINYVAPTTGRTLGPVYDILALTPALPQDGSADHEGDEISVEAVTQSNPDLILVMDRDAAVAANEAGYVPADKMLKESQALKDVNAIKDNKVVIMPADTYVNESIQTYTEFFNAVAEVLEK